MDESRVGPEPATPGPSSPRRVSPSLALSPGSIPRSPFPVAEVASGLTATNQAHDPAMAVMSQDKTGTRMARCLREGFQAARRSECVAVVFVLLQAGCSQSWWGSDARHGIVVAHANDASDDLRAENDDLHTGDIFLQFISGTPGARWEVTSEIDVLTDRESGIRQDFLRLELAHVWRRRSRSLRLAGGLFRAGDLGGEAIQNRIHSLLGNAEVHLDYTLGERHGAYVALAGERTLASLDGFHLAVFTDGVLCSEWWPDSAAAGVGVCFAGPRVRRGVSLIVGYRHGYRRYFDREPEVERWFGEDGTLQVLHVSLVKDGNFALRFYASRDPYCIGVREQGVQLLFGAAARRGKVSGPLMLRAMF